MRRMQVPARQVGKNHYKVQGVSASQTCTQGYSNSKICHSLTGIAAISSTVTQDESLGGFLHSHSDMKKQKVFVS